MMHGVLPAALRTLAIGVGAVDAWAPSFSRLLLLEAQQSCPDIVWVVRLELLLDRALSALTLGCCECHGCVFRWMSRFVSLACHDL